MRKKSPPFKPRPEKKGLHPRNRHTGRYDFEELTQASPGLAHFVRRNDYGDPSVDFADPEAVKALNRALLAQFYEVSRWDIPEGYLCPPIPGRADYLHSVADLLGASNGNVIPRGEQVRVLDIGVGASLVYPIIGSYEYGWSFVGTEVDATALDSAKRIIDGNSRLKDCVSLRQQTTPPDILHGMLNEDERFDLMVCNPPFHRSLEEAREETVRKWKGLGKRRDLDESKPTLNFGGQGSELWCPGGEAEFVSRMIDESTNYPTTFFWLSSLVSKEASLPIVYEALERADVATVRTLDIAHGQKKSRIVTWTFLSPREQAEWRERRWSKSAQKSSA